MEILSLLTVYHIPCIFLTILVIFQWFILHNLYKKYVEYKDFVKILRFLEVKVNEKFTIINENNKEINNNPFYFTETKLIDNELKDRKDLLIPLTVGKYKIKK